MLYTLLGTGAELYDEAARLKVSIVVWWESVERREIHGLIRAAGRSSRTITMYGWTSQKDTRLTHETLLLDDPVICIALPTCLDPEVRLLYRQACLVLQ